MTTIRFAPEVGLETDVLLNNEVVECLEGWVHVYRAPTSPQRYTRDMRKWLRGYPARVVTAVSSEDQTQ